MGESTHPRQEGSGDRSPKDSRQYCTDRRKRSRKRTIESVSAHGRRDAGGGSCPRERMKKEKASKGKKSVQFLSAHRLEHGKGEGRFQHAVLGKKGEGKNASNHMEHRKKTWKKPAFTCGQKSQHAKENAHALVRRQRKKEIGDCWGTKPRRRLLSISLIIRTKKGGFKTSALGGKKRSTSSLLATFPEGKKKTKDNAKRTRAGRGRKKKRRRDSCLIGDKKRGGGELLRPLLPPGGGEGKGGEDELRARMTPC